jgi:hypothetical protein
MLVVVVVLAGERIRRSLNNQSGKGLDALLSLYVYICLVIFSSKMELYENHNSNNIPFVVFFQGGLMLQKNQS